MADRRLLTGEVRFLGDEIAVVAAVDEATARAACRLIRVSYDPWPVLVDPADILAPGATRIHDETGNLAGEHCVGYGGDADAALAGADHVVTGTFETAPVQHCHLENHIAWASMDDLDRITIVTATQIPHIVRRIVAEALDMAESRIRVIKPFVGGGFGNKQDVILEPMVAFLTLKLSGRPVGMGLTREEGMTGTRTRHRFCMTVTTGVMNHGTLTARKMDAVSVTGAYASHGHAVAAAGGGASGALYPRVAARYRARTVYATLPAAGAMRAYGSPQVMFALECAVEDAARAVGMDSVAFRLRNIARQGDVDPQSGKQIQSCGLDRCLARGKEMIEWDRKKAAYAAGQTGPVRRGLGVACFSYASGTWPENVEIAGARLILNPDGTVQVSAGAVEIGQGSDTVIAQMAARSLGMDYGSIRVVQAQDTDVTPYDPGAYASRQAYVAGNAVAEAAALLRRRILGHAARMTGLGAGQLDIQGRQVVRADTRTPVEDLAALARDAYYHKTRGRQLTAEASVKTTAAAPAFGCTFVDLAVDIPLCRITLCRIVNVHDSGVILNPVQAAGQVHGGMAMGIGAALSEELLADPDTGRILNPNLLDYKVPFMTDIPWMDHAFVETVEPTTFYGNKALGEPPVITPAPAIRNALLDATGIRFNRLPITRQVLFEQFTRHGLIQRKGPGHV